MRETVLTLVVATLCAAFLQFVDTRLHRTASEPPHADAVRLYVDGAPDDGARLPPPRPDAPAFDLLLPPAP